MSDSFLSLVWSRYIHSPDPASGMATLRDTCVALLNYTFSSSHLIPALAGVALHADLAEPLREVTPILKHLLYAAAEHRHASQPLFDRDHTDFRLVTTIGVPQEDAADAWARLTHKLAGAMRCLEYICSGAPLHGQAAPPGAASATRTSSNEVTRIPRPTESTSRRDVHSRQAGRAVEEVLDNGATRHAEAATGVIPAKESVMEEAEVVATHGSASPFASPD